MSQGRLCPSTRKGFICARPAVLRLLRFIRRLVEARKCCVLKLRGAADIVKLSENDKAPSFIGLLIYNCYCAAVNHGDYGPRLVRGRDRHLFAENREFFQARASILRTPRVDLIDHYRNFFEEEQDCYVEAVIIRKGMEIWTIYNWYQIYSRRRNRMEQLSMKYF